MLLRFVDIVVDVLKVLEYLGFMLGRLVCVGVFILLEVGKLLEVVGESFGEVREEGYVLMIFGVVLEMYWKEKGEE